MRVVFFVLIYKIGTFLVGLHVKQLCLTNLLEFFVIECVQEFGLLFKEQLQCSD